MKFKISYGNDSRISTDITPIDDGTLYITQEGNMYCDMAGKRILLTPQSNALEYIINAIYPIGSIYISVNNTPPPDILFGGTWEQIKDKFLLSTGDIYLAGEVGGEAEHTLTVDELPSHNHMMKSDLRGDTTWEAYTSYVGGWSQYPFAETTAGGETTNTGGDVAHNNMPPYLTVYMWKRIS